MRYRLQFDDDQGKPFTLVGGRTVESGNPLRIWPETTTLSVRVPYVRVPHGDVAPGEEPHGEVVAAGIVRLGPLDFLRELTTFRVSGSSPQARLAALARFATLFLGKLWDVYARGVQHPAPF